ncbi:hypothetical protein L6452_20539 [Arctium lappa]|uniref:Uncharacterized protein n=1 Tax=Arctium lappa TaxID=4217 RepID=A0ACB9BC65_ARCLA|nr:hypothetical protein L6452_20539 [Arctium lappa]
MPKSKTLIILTPFLLLSISFFPNKKRSCAHHPTPTSFFTADSHSPFSLFSSSIKTHFPNFTMDSYCVLLRTFQTNLNYYHL